MHVKFMSHACSMQGKCPEIHACYMKHASMLMLQHPCLGDTCRLHVTCMVHVLYFELGECPTLIYTCRRAYRKVMVQQQGFGVCDVPEVNNLSKLPSFTMLCIRKWLHK